MSTLRSIVALSEGVRVSLDDFGGASAVGGTGQVVRAGFRFNSDGTIDERSGAAPTSYSPSGRWRTGGGNAALYEIRVTVNSGPALDVGSAGVDLALTSDRTFEQHVEEPDLDDTNSLFVEIKRVADNSVIDSKTVTLSASIVL